LFLKVGLLIAFYKTLMHRRPTMAYT